jgi:hypothetical protein
MFPCGMGWVWMSLLGNEAMLCLEESMWMPMIVPADARIGKAAGSCSGQTPTRDVLIGALFLHLEDGVEAAVGGGAAPGESVQRNAGDHREPLLGSR